MDDVDCCNLDRSSPSINDASQAELVRLQMCEDEADARRNLIVNYIPPSMKDEEIRALFGNYGEIETCKLIRDKLTGQCLGYGFVKFVNPKDAERALMALNGLRLQNKVIKVSVARPSSPAIKAANLYVSGLPKHFTVDDLHRLFAFSGKIVTSRILFDNQTGISKGVAFVRFDQRCDAERAVAEMNGRMIDGHKEPLVVKFANTPTTYLDRAKKSTLSSLVNVNSSQSTQQLPLLASSLQSLAHALPIRNITAMQIPNMAANQPLLFQSSPLLLSQMVGVQQPFNVLNMPLTNAIGNGVSTLNMGNGVPLSTSPGTGVNVNMSVVPNGTNAAGHTPTAATVTSAGGPIHSHAQHGRLRYSPLEGCTIPVPTLSTTLNSPNVVVSTSGSQHAAGATKHNGRPSITVSNTQPTQPNTMINGSSAYAGGPIDSLGGQPIGMLNGALNRSHSLAFSTDSKMLAASMPPDLLTLIGCGVNYSPF